jgi:hypothetical protein
VVDTESQRSITLRYKGLAGYVVVGPNSESAGLVTEVANLAGLTSMVGRQAADGG